MGRRIQTNGSDGLGKVIIEPLNMTFLKISNEIIDRVIKLKCYYK